MSMPPDTLAIETACLSAWPSRLLVQDRSWQWRLSGGYTKRANSVHCLDPADDADAPARLAAMADLYASHGAPPVFRVTPLAGPGVVAALDAAGWQSFEPSLVLAMPMPQSLSAPLHAVTLLRVTDPEWQAVQARLSGYDKATSRELAAILERIAVPARAILIHDEAGAPVAAALAMVSSGIGVYLNVVVDAARRGHGFGRALMQAALRFTQAEGARHAAIQVLAANMPAVTLYTGLGFAEVYRYHYRRPA